MGVIVAVRVAVGVEVLVTGVVVPAVAVAVGVAVTVTLDTVNCDVHTRPLDASVHGILGMVRVWNGKIK